MNKFILKVLIVVFSLFQSGCLKKEKNDRIIWGSEYVKNDLAASHTFPFISDNKVIISIANVKLYDKKLLAFDKSTGKKLWEWKVIKKTLDNGKKIFYSLNKIKQYQNVIVGVDNNHIFGIDIETGKTLWHNIINFQVSGRSSMQIDENIYYIGRDQNNNSIKILNVDMLTGNYDFLINIESMHDNYKILSYSTIKVYTNEVNEKCLIFGAYHVKNAFNPDEIKKYNIFNYNIDKKEFVYKKEFDFKVGINSFFIHKNKLYGDGECFSTYDLTTGQLLNQFNEDVSTLNPYTSLFDYPYIYLMYNNLINKFVKVNMKTGKEVWRISLDGHQSYMMRKKDNRIFMTARNGKLYVVDSDSGAIIEKVDAPYARENYDLVFDDNISIDTETGYLFCSDFKHLFCYDFDR